MSYQFMNRRYIKPFLLSAGMALGSGTLPAQGQPTLFKHVEQLPDYPVKGGVSGCYAGFVNDWLIVAGGCNFPDVPVAEGGKKKYYNKVYALNVAVKPYKWQPLPDFPVAVAYGAAVETTKGLVCVGGMNDTALLSSVYRIELEADGTFTYKSLPSLPVTINNHAAAATGDTIYVAGGAQSEDGQGVYCLAPEKEKSWKKLTDNPGCSRTQPVLLVDGGKLYLAGGFYLNAEAKHCELPIDVQRYDLSSGKWQTPLSLPSKNYSVVGGSGVACDGRLVLSGGVDPVIFKDVLEGRGPADYLSKPVDWYQFNKDVLIYSFADKAWSIVHSVPGVNRAGGVLLHHKGYFYMVGGELKPGIRTATVLRYQ